MTYALLFLSQAFLVAAQVLIKRGLDTRRMAFLAGGVGFMTGWFLLWTGLLRGHDLSLLYPFQGLSPVLMVLASAIFLRERPTWRVGAGVLLIAAGTALVGLTHSP